jgi:hypothetical protein
MSETSIYKKILALKSEIGVLTKNSSNPFFKSKYLDLGDLLTEVEPLVDKNQLVLLQPIEDGKVVTKIVDVDSGESIQSSIIIPASITDPQKLGSAITYFRRYTLQSLLALQAQDDDGNNAAKPPKKKELPPCDDVLFESYLEAILTGTQDKKGVTITQAYLELKHKLSDAQLQELSKT